MTIDEESFTDDSAPSLIDSVGRRAQEKAALIWNIADTLRGLYKPQDYGKVILPMTVVKRFHDCLLPTHNKQIEASKKTAGKLFKA